MRSSFKVATYIVGIAIIAISAAAVFTSLPPRVQDAAASGMLVGGVSCATLFSMAWLWRRLRELIARWLPVLQSGTRESANHAIDLGRRVGSKGIDAVRTVTGKSDAGARYDNLFKVKELFDAGIISAEEYEKERKRLLE